MLGTLNRHKEKNIDSVIQYIYSLRGTVQAIVPESKGPELVTPQITQSHDKKRDGGLATNPSEASSRRCRLVLWLRTDRSRLVGQEHLECDRQWCCFLNSTVLE